MTQSRAESRLKALSDRIPCKLNIPLSIMELIATLSSIRTLESLSIEPVFLSSKSCESCLFSEESPTGMAIIRLSAEISALASSLLSATSRDCLRLSLS